MFVLQVLPDQSTLRVDLGYMVLGIPLMEAHLPFPQNILVACLLLQVCLVVFAAVLGQYHPEKEHYPTYEDHSETLSHEVLEWGNPSDQWTVEDPSVHPDALLVFLQPRLERGRGDCFRPDHRTPGQIYVVVCLQSPVAGKNQCNNLTVPSYSYRLHFAPVHLQYLAAFCSQHSRMPLGSLGVPPGMYLDVDQQPF